MKIFCTDYDGTLYRNGVVSDEDLMAIAEFRDAGHKFGIVTGRGIDSIRSEINRFDIPVDFIVGSNGGVVLDTDMNELYISRLTTDISAQLTEMIGQQEVDHFALSDGYGLARIHLNHDVKDGFESGVEDESVEAMLANGANSYYVVTPSDQHAEALALAINEQFSDQEIIAFPNLCVVDIGLKGVTKATGIAHIANHFEHDGDIITIGDNFNDLPMIKAYHGIAMDNGVGSIKRNAKEVAMSVGEALRNHKD